MATGITIINYDRKTFIVQATVCLNGTSTLSIMTVNIPKNVILSTLMFSIISMMLDTYAKKLRNAVRHN